MLPKPSNVDIDAQLTGLVARSGGDYSQIPEAIKQSLRAELGNALATGKEVDPAALSRLIDFKRTGLTPTRGMVSLDPVQLTQEKNLAKIAANTANGELQGLPRLENQNNAKLIENLNTLGAQRGNILEAGNRVCFIRNRYSIKPAWGQNKLHGTRPRTLLAIHVPSLLMF